MQKYRSWVSFEDNAVVRFNPSVELGMSVGLHSMRTGFFVGPLVVVLLVASTPLPKKMMGEGINFCP